MYFHKTTTPIADQTDDELLRRRRGLYRIYAELYYEHDDKAFDEMFGDAVEQIVEIEAVLDDRKVSYPSLDKERVMLFSREKTSLLSTSYLIASLARVMQELLSVPSLAALASPMFEIPTSVNMEIRDELRLRGLTNEDIERMLREHAADSTSGSDGSSDS